MNWRDPDGIWQHGVRSWRQLLLALVGLLVFTAILPALVMLYFLPQGLHLTWLSIALLCLAGALIIGAAFLAVRWVMRVNALLKLVPDHDGRVCPKCEVAIAPSESSDQLRCSRCGNDYTLGDLQAHWRRYGVSPMQRSRWMNEGSFIEDGAIQNAIRVRAMRRSSLQFLMVIGLIFGAFTAFNMMIWSSPGAVLPAITPFLLFGLALVLFNFGWRAVEPHRRFCTACQYEREETAGSICPECGSEWDEPGATTAGRVEPRKGPLIGAGLAVGTLFTMLATSFMGANLSTRLTPTNMLINRVAATDLDVRSMTLHQDLGRRTLNDEQRRRLIEMLIEKRGRDALTIYDGQWLGAQHAAGTIPTELLDEFHRGLIDVELRAPQRVKVGEAIDVTIHVVDRFSLVGTQHPTVIVGGFYVDDDPTPRERQIIAKAPSLLGEECRVPRHGLTHQGQGPRLELVAQEPGTVRVQFEFWLLVMRRLDDVSFIVRWNDGGTPSMPERYEWAERIVIERTIDVLEDR